jgi:hypothetical protein
VPKAALLLVLTALAGAEQPCPPGTAEALGAAWTAYRAERIDHAARLFARADSLCSRNLDSKVGLGYVALRRNRTGTADSLFRLVVAADSGNADAWSGLSYTAYRAGNVTQAAGAARRALALNPKDVAIRELLARIDPDWDRPPIGPPVRLPELRVDARTQGERFEIPAAGGWRPFYIAGVNMGVALPGKYPSEFPTDSATYASWLRTIAAMHANTLRLYTILPPSFYRAFRAWNITHLDQPLRLIHGVWTEPPPDNDFDDPSWKEEFRTEMRRVVNLLHGAAEIPVQPGHAGGRYAADVSPWAIGYIIGREWEPFGVKVFDERHPGSESYQGRYLEMATGTAMDRWTAEQCDYLLSYEVETWNTIRPVAYTSWPTLDPLFHPTEATGAEEREWRRKRGQEVANPGSESDEDAIGLDAMLVRPTPANQAGWFASFHAYPYYPDFIIYDPDYLAARSSEGPSNYFGYLQALHRHHAGMPVVIAEYGVPSSRGVAHLQPQGWNHGGHDEMAMAAIDARLTRETRESCMAGGVLFAWLDEWFKKNWVVADYEVPAENTRRWHNVMDAEQNYGVLGMYAGKGETTPEPGGRAANWRTLPIVQRSSMQRTGTPTTLRLGADESYLYLAIEFAASPPGNFPWDSLGMEIALDTYRPDLGQRRLPGGLLSGDIGFEFLADFRSPGDADLRVTPDYNPYAGTGVIVNGDSYGRFAHRPVTTSPRDDGRFDSLFVLTNGTRFGRDGRMIPAKGYNRGRLRYGRYSETTLTDWFYDPSERLLEVRLAWGLINVSDPSTATVLFEQSVTAPVGTAHSDGFRVGVVSYRKGSAPQLVGALPVTSEGKWRATDFKSWTWPTWTAPRYHQRLKPVYDSLQAVWGTTHVQ